MFSSQLKKAVVSSTVLLFLCHVVSQLRGILSAHCTAPDQISPACCPRDGSKGKGQKQKRALKLCLPRLGCQHALLSPTEPGGRQEEKLSQSCLLKQI